MNARRTMGSLLALALWIGLPLSAAAQVFTGRIDVSIADSTGAMLPGVVVELTGPQHQSSVTDEKGEVTWYVEH